MAQSLEERIAYLEGKVEEHSRGFGDLTVRIDALGQKVDRFRAELSGRIGAISARIDVLDQRIDRFRGELSGRIDALDQKMSRQFVWLVGIQVAVLLAIIGALLR